MIEFSKDELGELPRLDRLRAGDACTELERLEKAGKVVEIANLYESPALPESAVCP